MMDRRRFLLTSLAGALAAPLAARAQQAEKTPRIGYLGFGSGDASSANRDAFLQGLRDLGYIEGETIFIEYRWAQGRSERLPVLARELVAREVKIIVAVGTGPVEAAMGATATIPIVVPFTSDLLTTGKLASLARPTTNITGLTAIAPELSGKRLELLQEAVPKVSRVAVLWSVARAKALKWGPMGTAAQTLGLKLQSLEMRGGDDLPRVFSLMREQGANALLVFNDGVTVSQREAIATLAAKNRLPAMYELSAFVNAGGLMAYGPNLPAMYRRAATYVDRILRGAKPADLPVEQPTKLELVINLKTAKALGLTIPPSLLARADQVIE
jgi:putative tryptophan/tyrosine transport system substrate-binding protein